MATINEVQSDAHRYLIFDAVALPVGDGIHSTVGEDGDTVDTTITRTEGGVRVQQTSNENDVDEEWSLKDVATYAASGHLHGGDPDMISVSDEFIEEHMDPERFAEYQDRLAGTDEMPAELRALLESLGAVTVGAEGDED